MMSKFTRKEGSLILSMSPTITPDIKIPRNRTKCLKKKNSPTQKIAGIWGWFAKLHIKTNYHSVPSP